MTYLGFRVGTKSNDCRFKERKDERHREEDVKVETDLGLM